MLPAYRHSLTDKALPYIGEGVGDSTDFRYLLMLFPKEVVLKMYRASFQFFWSPCDCHLCSPMKMGHPNYEEKTSCSNLTND